MESPKVTSTPQKTPRGQGRKNSQETLGNSRGFFGYQDHIFTEPEIGELQKTHGSLIVSPTCPPSKNCSSITPILSAKPSSVSSIRAKSPSKNKKNTQVKVPNWGGYTPEVSDNLKMIVSKEISFFQGLIFRFYVGLRCFSPTTIIMYGSVLF